MAKRVAPDTKLPRVAIRSKARGSMVQATGPDLIEEARGEFVNVFLELACEEMKPIRVYLDLPPDTSKH